MPVSSKDYVESADVLSANGAEIDWRNAISRAYYGAFHWGLANVGTCNALPHAIGPLGAHDAMIKRYEHHGDNAGKSIAFILNAMKTKRKVADYRLDDSITQIEAVTQVETARKVIDRISAFSNAGSPEASSRKGE